MNHFTVQNRRPRTSFLRSWLACIVGVLALAAGNAPAATITATDSAGFAAALTNAVPGDTIVLVAGTTYLAPVTSFVLPNKSGTSYITIQSSQLPSLPAPGRRVFPANAVNMPKIQTPGSNAPALKAAPGAHHYKLVGLEFIGPANNSNLTAGLLAIGDGSSAQNSSTQVPNNFIIDRCILRGNTATQSITRMVAMHGAYVDVTNCHITGAHFDGIEAQCVGGWNGPGPYNIINNYLEAAGEQILFGGATVSVPNNVPSDILVSKNHFHTPPAWIGQTTSPNWAVKNHLELKAGKRVTIEGNLFDHSFHDAGNQKGASLVFKTIREPGQGNSWTVTDDITVTKNIIRNVGVGIVIAGSTDTTGAPLTGYPRNMLIKDNIFQDINQNVTGNLGSWIHWGSGSLNVTFDHNTSFHSNNIGTIFLGAPATGFVFKNNLTNQAGYGWKGDNKSDGAGTLDYYFPGAIWQKNIIQGGNIDSYVSPTDTNSDYPSGFSPEATAFPTSWSGVLVNHTIPGSNFANWKVVNGSAYDNAGTDGKDIGADIDAVVAATAGCVTGVWSNPPVTRILKNASNGYTGATSFHVSGQSPTTHFGPSTYQHVLNHQTGSNGYVFRPFYKFDLAQGTSAIPANATIDSAVLRIPVTFSGASTDRTVKIHRVAPHNGFTVNYATATKNTYNGTTAWSGGNNAGGDAANTNNDFVDTPDSTATLPAAGTTGDLVFDVKSSVQAWVTGTPNQGWLLITGSTTSLSVYLGAADDTHGATDYPELTIIYR